MSIEKGSLVYCANAKPETYSGLELHKYYLVDSCREIGNSRSRFEITVRTIDGTKVRWKNDSKESTFYSQDRFHVIDLDADDRAFIVSTIFREAKKC